MERIQDPARCLHFVDANDQEQANRKRRKEEEVVRREWLVAIIGLVVLTIMLLPKTGFAQKIVNDRNWHLCLSMSGYGVSSDFGAIYDDIANSGEAYKLGGGTRITLSLSKRVAHLLSVGARASYGGEGEANVNGAQVGTGAEYLAIAELRQPLGRWFGIKGTFGAGVASYRKTMGLYYYGWGGDIGEIEALLDSYGSVSEKSFELLIEPTLELRISSVVTFEVIGSYRYLSGKTVELGSSRIEILKSRFTMGGGLGFHIS
jgi:hypothetical protein